MEEDVLWQYLRRKQLGVRFRRQHPIGDYIADFVCLEKQLVIEIDGGYHYRGEMPDNDAERTSALNRMGYQVIRFSNKQVMDEIDAVVAEISKKINI